MIEKTRKVNKGLNHKQGLNTKPAHKIGASINNDLDPLPHYLAAVRSKAVNHRFRTDGSQMMGYLKYVYWLFKNYKGK